jgi:hypothetical protein
VREALSDAEVVAEYPHDRLYPSRLVLGYASGRPLHVVVGEESGTGTIVVITVYEPNLALWHDDFRTRRKR